MVQCCSLEYDGSSGIFWRCLVRYVDPAWFKCHFDPKINAGQLLSIYKFQPFGVSDFHILDVIFFLNRVPIFPPYLVG